MVKHPSANAGDTGGAGLISGSGRSPGEGSGAPLQYSCLGNRTDKGAWQATVQGVTKSQTRLSNLTTTYLCGGHNFLFLCRSCDVVLKIACFK